MNVAEKFLYHDRRTADAFIKVNISNQRLDVDLKRKQKILRRETGKNHRQDHNG